MSGISRVGFLGLGAMGGAFSTNLVRAGYEAVGYAAPMPTRAMSLPN